MALASDIGHYTNNDIYTYTYAYVLEILEKYQRPVSCIFFFLLFFIFFFFFTFCLIEWNIFGGMCAVRCAVWVNVATAFRFIARQMIDRLTAYRWQDSLLRSMCLTFNKRLNMTQLNSFEIRIENTLTNRRARARAFASTSTECAAINYILYV